ncbi:MAG: PQQ-binding-like beta-propeller repeat protein [Candidatus Omnitrophota bacterium]
MMIMKGVLEVVAAGFHHFKIIHDGNAIAGVPEQITVIAKDASDVTVTNYTGTMTLDTNGTATEITWALQSGAGIFNDNGANADTSTYTFNSSDNGIVVLTITNTQTQTINISASGSGKTDDNSEGNLIFNPLGLNHFTINHDANAIAGVVENITIIAHDANNNPVANYTGTITLDTNGTAGTIAWSNISGNGIFNDGGPTVDTATYTFAAADNGTVTLGIADTKTESFNISVSGDGKTDDNTEGNISVIPNTLNKFVINHDASAQAGVAENITITAKDAYANTITNYTGTITVDTNGTATTITWSNVSGHGVFNDNGALVDTADYTFSLADNGIVILSITDTTVENLNISANGDGKADDDTEGILVVGAGALDKFIISHDAAAYAGIGELITVKAYDIYANIKTNYIGTITIDTNGSATSIAWALDSGLGVLNDGGASVDTATYNFVAGDNGLVVLMFTDTFAESVDIDISGSGKFDDDTEGNMVVSPSGLDHFKIVHDSSATAGIAENISIYAKDYYNNTQNDYSGTITLDTTGTVTTITWANVFGNGTFIDGGANADTATYTYAPADNGVVSLSLNDTTAEILNISVSGDGKFDDDTEGGLTVNPNVLNYFTISHDGTAVQSVGEEINVTAKDQYGNIKIDYVGTIILDTDGDVNNISWLLHSGAGYFTEGGASVDTAMYTFAQQDNGVASFDLTDNTAQTLNIDVTDSLITDDNTEGVLVVQASSLTVDITANALSSGYIKQGESNKLVLDLTLTNNNVLALDTVKSFTINNSGTIFDAQISAVKLYYDSNNSGEFELGVDSQIGIKTFSSGTATFADLNVNIPIAGTEELYATVDLAGTVTNGATVDLSVPVNGISFEFSPTAEDSVLNSTGSYIVDSVVPGNISGLATNSHNNAISMWSDPQSKDNTVAVSWTPAVDADSGLDGYSVLWDNNPTTIPDNIKDIEQTQNTATSPVLANGNTHYVHIRSVDNVGNWALTAAHLGPFYIDTQAPTATSIYQITEYAGGDYLSVSGNLIYYSGLAYSAFRVCVSASDAASGLKEALFPTTTSTGGVDTTEDAGAYQYLYTYEISSSGANYNNVNAVVYDNAGNTANVPFSVVLDSTAPNFVTTLTSSSHTQGVPSINNDIQFTWSDVTDTQSGVAGYSIIVNTSPTTIPPQYINVDQGQGTYTANDLASGSYYGHIRSVDNVGNWSSTVTHAGPYIIGRGNLTAAVASSKNIVSTDQQFTVTMTVNNTGSSLVNDVDPSVLTVSSTGGATATTSSNPSAQNIDPAGQKQFQWTYTAGASAGTVSFAGYAQGTDTDGIIKSTTVSSNDITIVQKASLTLNVYAAPATVNTNENITIKVTVSNPGQADALNVAPVLIPSGSANPIIDSGPSPTTATIKGGRSKEFIFIGHGSGAGVANFAAGIAQGIDANSNAVLTATQAQDSVTVQSPPSYAMTSSISATPSSVQPSDTITVTMNVQNTGGSILNNITPSSLAVGGSSSDALYATGPIPASIATLGSGATQQFSWTYNAGSTLGIVNFTGHANATETASAASASSDIRILTESAALTSSIAATPSSLLTNATITVTMTVTNTANTGGATAQGVSPSIITIGGTSAAANLLTGPIPLTANIAPQTQQNFIWTYKAGITSGTVNFTGNASGVDSSSQADVSSIANVSANVSISTLNADWIYPTGANVLGPIRSIPIAYWGMENKIYIGSDDNNLYILNGDTHELETSFTTSGKIRGLPYPSTDIDGADLKDIVYFGTVGKTVYGLWADNTLRWNRVMGESLTTTVLYDYVSGVYFGTTANNIYCIDSADGTDAWGAPAAVGGAIESSPAMIYVPTLDYDEIYFGASDGKVYGFKAVDGTGARTFDTGFGSEGAIKTAPTITLQNPSVGSSRRLMLFGTTNGKFYAVNTSNLSSDSADTGWTVNPISVGGAVYSAPWFDTGSRYVFFGSQDGKLYAVSITDGSMKPNFPVDVGSPIDSWPLVENGIVYFGADNGKFYAVDVATGQIVPGWPYDTGAAIKGGAALHLIYNTETWDVQETYVLVGPDSGKIYSFKAVK